MAQYIPKEPLVAKIDKLEEQDFSIIDDLSGRNAYLQGISDVLEMFDTFEVKEVDLEKALSDLDKDIKEFVTTEEFENESATAGHYWVIAKHAFLLGLKAQKGE